MATLIKQYFTDRNYTLIYIHNLFNHMSKVAIHMLTGVYFFDLGVSIPLILLFFALQYGLVGLLCPIGLKVFNVLGSTKAMALAHALRIAFMFLLVLVEIHHGYMFVALLFYAMSGAIAYPFKDVIEAIYINHDHNRAKQLAFSMALSAIFASFSVVIGALLLSSFGFIGVSIFVAAVLALSTLPFVYLVGEDIHIEDYKLKDGYKFPVSDEFKDLLLPVFGEQARRLMSMAFVPLFIYLVVGDLKMYGYLAGAAILVEMLFTVISGHRADRNGPTHALKHAFYLNAFNSVIFSMFVVNPFMALVADSFNKISSNVHAVAFKAGIHMIARDRIKSKLMLFGCAYQMSLCVFMMLTLIFCSILAMFIGQYIFYVGFFLSAFGCYLSWRFFESRKDLDKEL